MRSKKKYFKLRIFDNKIMTLSKSIINYQIINYYIF